MDTVLIAPRHIRVSGKVLNRRIAGDAGCLKSTLTSTLTKFNLHVLIDFLERICLQQKNGDALTAVHRAAEVLRNGGIAVLPTDTVYGLAARLRDVEAVKKIIRLKGRNENHPFAAAFPSIESIAEWGLHMQGLALRLCRRCLPGPVSLVLDILPGENRFRSLHRFIQKAASKNSAVCCRIPGHPLLLNILNELDEPIILTSANRSGEGESSTAEQIICRIGEDIDLLIDAGPISEPIPSTVVKISCNDYSILREGAVKSETIHRLASR